jgi:general secretion pathway protein J
MKYQRAFTLLEMLLGLALLGVMLVMIYSALNLGLRAWDTGEARTAESAHLRIVQGFLRRELSQVFPVRWRGIPESKIAFEGSKSDVKYVTALNLDAGLKDGGLQWAHLALVGEGDSRALVLKREPFDIQAKDWGGLDEALPVKLIEGITDIEFSYYGAENDTADPAWVSEWSNPLRMPQLVRLSYKTRNGRVVPDLIVNLKLGEEAGCYDSNFNRQCGPRRA